MKTYIYKGAQDFYYHDVCIAKLGETLEIGAEGIRNISNKNKFNKAPVEIIEDILKECEEYNPELGIDEEDFTPKAVSWDEALNCLLSDEKTSRDLVNLNKEVIIKLINLGVLSISKETCRSYNVGKSNYSKHVIQPWAIWQDYDLNPWDADIVKRILRTKVEEGLTETEARIMDYKKIIHICQERIRQLNGNI